MSAPSVSVVIPCWNRARWIEGAMRSVIDQRYDGEVQLIVADDGSTDGSLAAARAVADGPLPAGRSVEVLALEHRGIAPTIGAGIDRATGEYLAFLGSDDYWEPDRLAGLAAELDRIGGPAMVVTGCRVVDADGRPRAGSAHGKPYEGDRLVLWDGTQRDYFDVWHRVGTPAGGLSIFPRAALQGVWTLPTDIPEEDYWIFLAMLDRYPIVYVDQPTCVVRQHGEQITRSRNETLLWDPDGQRAFFRRARERIGDRPAATRLVRMFAISEAILDAKVARERGSLGGAVAASARAVALSFALPALLPRALAASAYVLSPRIYLALKRAVRGRS